MRKPPFHSGVKLYPSSANQPSSSMSSGDVGTADDTSVSRQWISPLKKKPYQAAVTSAPTDHESMLLTPRESSWWYQPFKPRAAKNFERYATRFSTQKDAETTMFLAGDQWEKVGDAQAASFYQRYVKAYPSENPDHVM